MVRPIWSFVIDYLRLMRGIPLNLPRSLRWSRLSESERDTLRDAERVKEQKLLGLLPTRMLYPVELEAERIRVRHITLRWRNRALNQA